MDSKNTHTLPGFLLACFTIFIWGITFICTKYLLSSFSALEILFTRFFLAYICLLILSPKKLILKKKSDELLFIAAGLTGITIYQLLENIAINYTSASNVSIIVSICPMFTAIIAQIFLKEKHINLFFITGFILSITGIVFVSFNGSAEVKLNPKGDLLALLVAISWGFYSLFLSLLNKRGYASITTTRRSFFWAVIFMIPLMLIGYFSGTDSNRLTLDLQSNISRFSNQTNIFCLCFLGILASGFAFAAWSKACDILGTVKTTIGIYLIPVVTIIFAFITLGEKMTVMGIIGTVLTIVGLFISSFKSNKKKAKEIKE